LRETLLRPLRGYICSTQKTQRKEQNVIHALWPPPFSRGLTTRNDGLGLKKANSNNKW